MDCLVTISFCWRLYLRQDWVQGCYHLKWGDYWLLLVCRVLELAPPQESWWSEVWILIPVSCRFCFRFVVIFVPSEETEHITNHHFIILTLWVQKNYKKNVCVFIVGGLNICLATLTYHVSLISFQLDLNMFKMFRSNIPHTVRINLDLQNYLKTRLFHFLLQ